MTLNSLTCPGCGAPVPRHILPKQSFQCRYCGIVLVALPSQPSNSDSGQPFICPTCQAVGNRNYKYCLKCGAKLMVDCPNCFRPNPMGNALCEHCGINFQEALQKRESWLKEKKHYDESRLTHLQQSEKERLETDIQRLLDDLDDPQKHPYAIFCLHERGTQAVEPLVETLCHDEDVDARYGAARTLGMIGDARAIPALIQALSDPEPIVRYWSIDALVNLQATSARAAIGQLKKDPFRRIRERAMAALSQIPPV